MPMDRKRYPKNWRDIALAVKIAADWKCRKCHVQCRRPGEPHRTHRLTLTVAHRDHTPENCEATNLIALCAPCHLKYDAPRKARERKYGKRADKQPAIL